MILLCDGHPYHYEMEALCRMFLCGGELSVLEGGERPQGDYIYTSVCGGILKAEASIGGELLKSSAPEGDEQELNLTRLLYEVLSTLTGIKPKWGVLTGIRPVRLGLSMREKGLSDAEICHELEGKRLVSAEKRELVMTTMAHEHAIIAESRPESFSLYISIPFCPTRCAYCSFISHDMKGAAKLIPQYVELLCRELRETAQLAAALGLRLETVYMGGGTPTVLKAEELEQILAAVEEAFDMSTVREITVEAGRPDTITAEKLRVLKRHKVSRISVNPQTLNDEVLEEIGRCHTAEQAVEAFVLAREHGFDNINMDLIAGLPKDSLESFCRTVDGVLELGPENITLHTLTVKRASRFAVHAAEIFGTSLPDDMLAYAYKKFAAAGYFPYYLYRQKGTVDNLENTGFSIAGREGLYNVFIMDETHTILAAGAGAVTKLRDPKNGHIERIYNYKFPYEYIERFDDISRRKGHVTEFYESYPARP